MGKNANPRQIAEIVRMFADGEYDGAFAQALIERRIETLDKSRPKSDHLCRSNQAESFALITVPDTSSVELVADLEFQLGARCINDEYRLWDFIRDEQGRAYKPITWRPNRCVTTQEVREEFKKLGADGNVPAFLYWVITDGPRGLWVSIPTEDDRLFRDAYGYLSAPCFRGSDDGGDDWLSLRDVRIRWSDRYSFVAFREVTFLEPLTAHACV